MKLQIYATCETFGHDCCFPAIFHVNAAQSHNTVIVFK